MVDFLGNLLADAVAGATACAVLGMAPLSVRSITMWFKRTQLIACRLAALEVLYWEAGPT